MEEDDIDVDHNDVERATVERYPNFITDKFSFLLGDEEEEELILCKFDFIRPIRCNLGILDMAHGSVKLYQGDTCVICAVYGPSDVRIAKELPHRAAVDVLYRPKITGAAQLSQNLNFDSTWEERNIESIITGILESTIILEDDLGAGFNIILHEYENDGCILAACINAVSVGLMKAGCSIRYPVAAVTVAFTKDNKLIIDPNLSQLKQGWQALMIYVFSNQGHVLYSNMQGYAKIAVLQLAMKQAQCAALELFRFQMKLVRHDNCQELGYKDGEDDLQAKDEPIIVDEESTGLNFTDLKVDNESDSEDFETDKESAEEDE